MIRDEPCRVATARARPARQSGPALQGTFESDVGIVCCRNDVFAGTGAGLRNLVAASIPLSATTVAVEQDVSHRLRRAVQQLEQAENVEQIVDGLRANARSLIGADGIAVILRDGEFCHYIEEDAISPLWKGGRFPLENCISGWAMRNRQTAVIPDILTDRRVPQPAYRGTFVRSMAMAPMGSREARGALGAYWAQTHSASPAEVRILERLAEAAGKQLERLSEGRPVPLASQPTSFAAKRHGVLPFDVRTWLLNSLPRETLPLWKGQLLAVAITLVSALLRHFSTPLIGSASVFTAFFPAIVVSALWGGPSAAVTATLLGTIAGAFISHDIEGSTVGWLVFAVVATIVAVVACAVRTALDHQHFRSGALEDRDRELASISRELDHRSKNTLAVVAALTRQASQSSETKEEMRDRLCGHFAAMAAAQTLLLDAGAKGLTVKQLIDQALAPFIEEGRVTVEVEPDLEAPKGSEVMLSLAFSELATNSCKYGALSVPSGQVNVAGASSEGQACVTWSESGGPRVMAPSPASTGSRLIRRTLASVPGGRVEPSFHPAGYRCEFAWSAGC